MKLIKESPGKAKWPRHKVESIECRKKDLIIRITDWMKDKDEPGYDVECYIGGVYDWNESKSFTMFEYKNPIMCKMMAEKFAVSQIAKLL